MAVETAKQEACDARASAGMDSQKVAGSSPPSSIRCRIHNDYPATSIFSCPIAH